MLEVDHLIFISNGKVIIDDLNLSLGEGEIHAVLGVNGTGKTTLAYLIMGIYSASKGRIVFDRQDITSYSVSQRAKMGITLAWQEPARFEGLSVKEYLELGKNLAPVEIENYLWMVGLPPSEYLSREVDASLSGGERKRIELASVLAMKPKLAILDEPDSGIDMTSQTQIANGILELRRQGASVLLISHSEKTVEIADKVSVLCAGKIIRTASPKEVCKWFIENCKVCDHINIP